VRGTSLVQGKRLKRSHHPERLAYWPDNRNLVADLYRRHRVELLPSDMVDGWIAPGARGQAWEHGPGRLGFTIIGAKAISSARRKLGDVATITQCGDDEAAFVCRWTPENLRRIAKTLRLYRRRGAPSVPLKPPTQSRNRATEAPISPALSETTVPPQEALALP